MPFNNANNNLVNFKELSTQLLSNFSSLNQQTSSTNVIPTGSLTSASSSSAGTTVQSTLGAALTTDEFIDNEIYKFVLNGRRETGIPPGFEINSKEAFEIEELGKKIATFNIETDSELSSFNTDEAESMSGEENDEAAGKVLLDEKKALLKETSNVELGKSAKL
jgi:hypothetical protein